MIRTVAKWVPTSITKRIRNFLIGILRGDATNLRPATALESIHIKNAILLPDRNHMLNMLPKNSVVAELGVNRGDFSIEILKKTTPREMHLIDSWDTPRYSTNLMREVQNRFAAEIQSNQVTIRHGLSMDQLATYPERFFDWVYIDTSHSYEDTKVELDLCLTRVKKGGIIAGHDYTIGNWNTYYRYGVIDAVNEFCVANHWELIMLTHEPDMHSSFAIREIQHGE